MYLLRGRILIHNYLELRKLLFLTSISLIPDDGFQLKPKHLHNSYYITAMCGCSWLHTYILTYYKQWVSCKTTIGSSVRSCGNFWIPDPTFCNVTVLLQTCSSVWLDVWSFYLLVLQICYITTICLSSGSCPWNYSGAGSSVTVVHLYWHAYTQIP